MKHKHTILPATVGWEMLALKRASGRAPISTTGILCKSLLCEGNSGIEGMQLPCTPH